MTRSIFGGSWGLGNCKIKKTKTKTFLETQQTHFWGETTKKLYYYPADTKRAKARPAQSLKADNPPVSSLHKVLQDQAHFTIKPINPSSDGLFQTDINAHIPLCLLALGKSTAPPSSWESPQGCWFVSWPLSAMRNVSNPSFQGVCFIHRGKKIHSEAISCFHKLNASWWMEFSLQMCLTFCK